MEKEPIQYAEDAVNMHFIYKKGYAHLVDLAKQAKLGVTIGPEKKISWNIFIFGFYYSGYPPILRVGSPNKIQVDDT